MIWRTFKDLVKIPKQFPKKTFLTYCSFLSCNLYLNLLIVIACTREKSQPYHWSVTCQGQCAFTHDTQQWEYIGKTNSFNYKCDIFNIFRWLSRKCSMTIASWFNWREWTRLNDGLIPISNDRDVAPGNIRLSTQQ